jgi:hypothetical protein
MKKQSSKSRETVAFKTNKTTFIWRREDGYKEKGGKINKYEDTEISKLILQKLK